MRSIWAQRRGELRVGAVARAAPRHAAMICARVRPRTAMMKGKPKFCAVGGVQLAGAVRTPRRALVEAGAGLLAARGVGELARHREPCRPAPGARGSVPAALRAARPRPRLAIAACSASTRPAKRPRCPGTPRPPRANARRCRRAGDEVVAVHGVEFSGIEMVIAQAPAYGWCALPVPRDVDAPADPDAVVLLHVVEEALPARPCAPGRPSSRQCRPTDIIFGALVAFGVEHVEGVLQVVEECVAGVEALGVAKRMSLASSV